MFLLSDADLQRNQQQPVGSRAKTNGILFGTLYHFCSDPILHFSTPTSTSLLYTYLHTHTHAGTQMYFVATSA